MFTRPSPAVSCLLLLASSLCLPGTGLAASDSHQLSVQAVVLSKNKCHFVNSGPTALNFGSIDPSAQGNVTAGASINFRCNGSDAVATFGVSSDDGLYESGPSSPRMQHVSQPGEYLPYDISFPSSGSVPRNTVQSLSLSGSISPASFQNASAGSYSDTIVLTITP